MDKMRESIFAGLGDLTGMSFLDLFSGSGIIALEAASRGATNIVAVEADKLKTKTIIENAAISPVRIQCKFIATELFVLRAKQPFDFIFCDPPFPYRYKWDLITKIASSALLGEKSLLMLHRPRADYCKEDSSEFFIEKSKEFGNSVVDFIRKKR
jgi:16S rRNA (guanine(966)-N(2))-methyltransferase RsmD